MNEREDRLFEIAALAGGIIFGAIILIIERLLFAYSIAPLSYTLPEDWLRDNYNPAAVIVFLVSAIAAIVWYLIALRWWTKFDATKDTTSARSWWILLFAFPIIIVIAAISLWGNEDGTSLGGGSLLVFSVLLCLGMLSSYWVSTGLSTPINMKHVVPFAGLLPR